MTSSKCILCMIDFIVTKASKSEHENVSLEKITEILCDYFSLCADNENDLWDVKKDGCVPLCQICQEIGVELCSLQEELELLQSKILKVIARVSSKILETPPSLRRKSLSQNICIDLDKAIVQKVFKFQSHVKRQYTPQLVLADCNLTSRKRIIKKGSRGNKEVVNNGQSIPCENEILLQTDNLSSSSSSSSAYGVEDELNDDSWNFDFDNDFSATTHLDEQDTTTTTEIVDKQKIVEGDVSSDVEWTHSNDKEIVTSENDDSSSCNDIEGVKEQEMTVEVEQVQSRQKSEHVGNGHYLYAGKYGFKKVGAGVQCDTCGVITKFRTHIYRHIKEVHVGLLPNKFQCSFCNKSVGSLKVFKSHLSKLHPETDISEKVVPCGPNKFLFDGSWVFQKSQVGFVCQVCGDNSSGDNQEKILQHIRNSHHGQLTCDECGKGGFVTKRALVGHKNNIHRDKKKPHSTTTITRMKQNDLSNSISCTNDNQQETSIANQSKPERFRSANVGGGRYLYDGKYGFVKNSKNTCICDICGLKMNLKHIHKHMRHKHMGLAPTKFNCSICGKSLSNLKSFLKHYSIFHPTTDLKSDIVVCGDGKFLVEGKWLFQKTIEGSFKCQSCGDLSKNQDNCLEHIRTHQFDNFACDECGQEFESNRALVRHKSNHDTTKKKKPGITTTTIIQDSGQLFVYRDVWKFEQLIDGGYRCTHCGVFFISRNGMLNHLKHSHADPTPTNGIYLFDGIWKYEKVDKSGFRCLTCGAVRKLKGCMDQHIKEHHSNPNSHVCEFCGKNFSSKQSFEYHTAKHKPFKHFMCENCGSRFRNKDELRQHKLSHKSWTCSTCNKVFSGSFGKSNMYHHKKRWHSQKKIDCFICKKTFLYKSELTQHLTTTHKQSTKAIEHCT